ncbi:MAG: alpha/beta hydrolase [Pseudomonadota bacterium]
MSLVIAEKNCFFPDAFEYLTPREWDLAYEPFSLPGQVGLLTGWHIKPSPRATAKNKVVLHLHGNAQNMSAHVAASYFLALEGFHLITFDYRGYGLSQGRPTLRGIIDDGRTVVNHLLANPPLPGAPLGLFGQSMGAFTAAHLLPFFPGLDGAVLEAGLISFRDLFLEAYPQAEVAIPEGLSTLSPLSQGRVPKLFIHGTKDQIVPLSHSERMFQAAAPPKRLLIIPGLGHIDGLDIPRAGEYRRAVVDFFTHPDPATES